MANPMEMEMTLLPTYRNGASQPLQAAAANE